MPMFVPRQRATDGRLLCPGCHPDGRGSEGRPIGVHGTLDEALGMVEEAGYEVKGEPKTAAASPDPARFAGWFDHSGYVTGEMPLQVGDSTEEALGIPGKVVGIGDFYIAVQTDKGIVIQLGAEQLASYGAKVDLSRVAHDSGDGQTIFHCPFCGSGQVTARSDGTVECDFCHTHFTVQVQPEHSAMPQTVNGTPFPIPGMPGDPTQREAPPAQEQPLPGEAAPAFTPPDSGDAFVPPLQQAAASVVPNGVTPSAIVPQTVCYITADRWVLPEDAYIRHLAISFADNRAAVIDAVRTSRSD